MSKFTPGPWKTVPKTNGFIIYGFAGMGSPIVETSEAAVLSRSQDDAALISSAPDLYSALEKIIASITLAGEPETARECYQLETARAALAKADGGQS